MPARMASRIESQNRVGMGACRGGKGVNVGLPGGLWGT
jgi:hypothetical protein